VGGGKGESESREMENEGGRTGERLACSGSRSGILGYIGMVAARDKTRGR